MNKLKHLNKAEEKLNMPVNFNNDNNIKRSEIMSQKREQFKLLNKDITLFEPQYVSQDENDDSISN